MLSREPQKLSVEPQRLTGELFLLNDEPPKLTRELILLNRELLELTRELFLLKSEPPGLTDELHRSDAESGCFPLAPSFPGTSIPGVMPRLQPVAEHLWVAQFPLDLKGVHLGRQMTVVELPSEHSLVLLDPGPLDDDVQHELARIGTVRHIVAPSLFHDTFILQALRAYPSATFHAPPGFEKVLEVDRRINVLGGPMPEEWQGVFQQELIAGMPMVNEVVTHHIPSGTLVVADLVFNIPPTASLRTKFFMRLNGAYPGVKASRMIRLTIRDRAAQRASLDRVLRWDFDRLIPSHGMMVEGGGHRALELAWAK